MTRISGGRRLPARMSTGLLMVVVLALSGLLSPATSTAAPVAATAGCDGALAWLEVTSCDAIAGGSTDTFTLTTTGPQESVLLKYTAPPENLGVVVTLTGHDVSCDVTPGPTRCDLGPVGAYTVTVQNTTDESLSYSLSAASLQRSDCTALSAADLSPAAAGHVVDLPHQLIANCFGFTGAAGDVVRFGDQASTAAVYDATGAEVCRADHWTSMTCSLSGTAPYRAFVTGVNVADSTTYRFTLARMNDPVGCPVLPPATFGAPGDALASGPLAGGQTTCRLITSDAGLHSIRLQTENNSSTIGWELYDHAGQRIQCGAECALPADGTYTMLLESSATSEGNRFDLAMVNLTSTAGCAPEVDTRWDTPVPTRTPVTAVQIDCQPITAKAGERILVHVRGETPGEKGATRIVDPSGAVVCPEDGAHDGCVLEGAGPFRVLTSPYPSAVTPYVLDLGRLSDPVGCVPATLTSFGAPAPAAAGSRCRELTVTTPTTYRIDPRTTYGDGAGRGAYGPDGLERCDDLLFCALEPGKYTVIAPATDRVAIFPLTSTAGCVSQAADTLSATVGGPSQYDCLQLSAPAGARIAQTEAAGERNTEGWVLDATGKSMCAWGPHSSPYEPDLCELVGTAPFRALIHRGPFESAVDTYHLAFPRLDQPSGCKPFPQSDFTAPGGVTTTLRPDGFVECFVVPADAHAAQETVEYARTGSVGTATTLSVPVGSDQRCVGRPAAARFTTCAYPAGTDAVVLLIGSAETAGYRIARRDITGAARGCTAVGSTAVGTTAGSGNLPDSSVVRCFTLTGAATDKFVVNTRDANNSIGASVHKPSGDYVCKTFAAARCVATGSTSYQVLAWNDPSFGPVGDFSLEAFRIASAAGPAPECAKVDSAYGLGPLTGELTATKTAACMTFPMAPGNQLNGYATNQVSDGALPDLSSYTPTGPPSCSSYAEGFFMCSGWQSQPWTETVLLELPEPAVGTLKYKLTANCETPLCGGAVFGVDGVTPASAAAGVPVTVTVKGKALHLKDVVRFTAAGQPDLVGVVKSVSADRTTATVTVDLTSAATGVRSLVVESFSGTSATVANAFTVTAKALVRLTSPTVVAPVRVGALVKSTPGTWSPAATSYTYQWRDNGAAIRGASAATYTPPAALLGHKLSVTVTAHRAGYASAAASSAQVVVASGLAPVATVAPVLTGRVQVGYTVATSAGTWSPTCTTLSYRWYSGGTAVVGGTGTKLAISAAMARKSLYAAVTCARTGHTAGRAVTKTYTVLP